ncbi:MAG: hypothetical protein WAS23_15545 [Dokdonella sp.]|uniref:hypothetical protein n=1 Tax=Dokdonella sp. TaxID=2291710 RepID=UPI003BB05280
MSHSLRNKLLCVVLVSLAGCWGDKAPAPVVVLGSVRDGATDSALEGAEVIARLGSRTQGRAFSDREGNFQMQFDAPASDGAQAFVLSASLGGYRATSTPFSIAKGRTTASSYPLHLVSDALASCTREAGPAVVVGHFRAPLGQPDPDLADRIAAALQYDLDEKVQTTRLVNSKRPGIFACGDVEPKDPERYGSFARFLGVDAFVGGIVSSPGSSNVRVQMFLADGYGFMTSPSRVVSDGVDLNDPSLSRLAPEAMTAVMTALVVGYKLANKPEECVELVGVSERLLPVLPDALVRLREECQAVLPNRGLL